MQQRHLSWPQFQVFLTDQTYCFLRMGCSLPFAILLRPRPGYLIKQPTISDVTTGFHAKWRSRNLNERRNSILMSCHYPDLGGASTLNGKQTPLKQVKRNFKIVYNSFSTNYEIIYDLQPVPAPGAGGLYSLIQGCAAGQGMVFVLSVLNREYSFPRLCPKQCAWFVRVCFSNKIGGVVLNRVLKLRISS